MKHAQFCELGLHLLTGFQTSRARLLFAITRRVHFQFQQLQRPRGESASEVPIFEQGMAFIMEFAENLVLRLMEDPKERDRKFRERMYDRKDRCRKTKEMWSLPIRPYGFWTFERHNAQLRWDPQISQVPGRRDPYDDLLEKSYDPSN